MLRYLEARVEWVRLRAGERLFAEGDTSRDVYFVLGGRLRGMSREGGFLGEMGRGESIGKIAPLTGEARSATVEAVRDSDLVRVSAERFDEIVARHPQLMQAVARIVVQRLRARERMAPGSASRKCMAVQGIGAAMPTAAFCEHLVQGLARIGSVTHLSAQRVEALLNQSRIVAASPEHAAGMRLTAWLDEQEASTQFLVYETHGTDSPWTRRCLRQADEALRVADAASDPAAGAFEAWLLGASGASLWFAGRDIQNHFHVRLDHKADFERMARCLAGWRSAWSSAAARAVWRTSV